MAKTAGNVLQMQRSRPLLEQVAERQSVAGVDAKTVATTTIFTTASGLGQFCVTEVVIEVTAATAEPDTPQATVSIGTAGSSDAEVIPATSLTTTLSANNAVVLRPDPTNQCRTVAPSTAIRIAITVAAISTGTLTYKVHVRGFYTGT